MTVDAAGDVIEPQHDARYWAALTEGLDFSEADRVPPALFNRLLWQGLKGSQPYPVLTSHVILAGIATPADDD